MPIGTDTSLNIMRAGNIIRQFYREKLIQPLAEQFLTGFIDISLSLIHIFILEGILAHIYGKQFRGRTLSREEMDREVEKGASGVVRSATFAVLIILIVFFPILTLNGIEGKYLSLIHICFVLFCHP